MKLKKLISIGTGSQSTSWKEIVFCEKCLNKNHSYLLKDWFIKIEDISQGECQSYAHNKNHKEFSK